MARSFPRRLGFSPTLAGATLRDRLLATFGGLAGVAVTGLVCHLLGFAWGMFPFLVAPMGASAVLLFAVPASPLAQPWSIVGGNTISALVGVVVAHLVPDPFLASGVAVGGAIIAMSMCRCLHPPGGAAALTAVLGGPAVAAAGYWFPLFPVGLNAVVLLLTGLVFHRFSGHSYPHRAKLTTIARPEVPSGLHRDDIARAVADFGETLDVSPDDLDVLLQRAEQHALARQAASKAPR